MQLSAGHKSWEDYVQFWDPLLKENVATGIGTPFILLHLHRIASKCSQKTMLVLKEIPMPKYACFFCC